MNFIKKNVQLSVYILSAIVALVIYHYTAGINSVSLRDIRYSEFFGLAAVAYLYLALLASPLYSALLQLPGKEFWMKAQPALGITAFIFALVHSIIGFFKLLGGFNGLGFLSSSYCIAIALSTIALLILLVSAAIMNPFAIQKLELWWKRLHRAIYLAGFLIIIHALMLGSHFIDLSTTIPQIFFGALIILLLLEALRIDKHFEEKKPSTFRIGYVFLTAAIAITYLTSQYLLPKTGATSNSLGVHAQHLQQIQQSGQSTGGLTYARYTVSFIPPQNITPNQPVTLKFKVYNTDSGEAISNFDLIQEKLLHLVIVNNGLTYFNHIHPDLNGSDFTVTTSFPAEDQYRLYLNFSPTHGQEQQFAFTLPVGTAAASQPDQKPSEEFSKTFGDYQVTLNTDQKFVGAAMSKAQQTLTFRIEDSQNRFPVLDLKPYLGAFGHLVMINETTYDYIHVHPTLNATSPNQSAGPEINFTPFGILGGGAIKPGVYKIFVQFNPNDKLFTADFTINVE